MTERALAIAALVLLLGCESETKKSNAAPADDALVAAWRKAGLEVSPLTDVDVAPYAATRCRGGTVSGVDVIVCTYDTGEDAAAALDPTLALLEKSGVPTASAIPRGKSLLIVSDKRKADPSGRTIQAITAAFRK